MYVYRVIVDASIESVFNGVSKAWKCLGHVMCVSQAARVDVTCENLVKCGQFVPLLCVTSRFDLVSTLCRLLFGLRSFPPSKSGRLCVHFPSRHESGNSQFSVTAGPHQLDHQTNRTKCLNKLRYLNRKECFSTVPCILYVFTWQFESVMIIPLPYWGNGTPTTQHDRVAAFHICKSDDVFGRSLILTCRVPIPLVIFAI